MPLTWSLSKLPKNMASMKEKNKRQMDNLINKVLKHVIEN